jgi:hypothetical protein
MTDWRIWWRDAKGAKGVVVVSAESISAAYSQNPWPKGAWPFQFRKDVIREKD